MTREEAKRRLLNIERSTPIHTREDARDFEALEMAIKALEQNESAEEWYKLFVEKLEQEPKWIPVSERLPETGTYCLVCCKDGFISTDNYFCYGWDDWEDDVVAWMPLPSPWKGDKDNG